MCDLSVLIAGRGEVFFSRTVQGVLDAAQADTEVIAVLDGTPADPPLPKSDRVTVLAHTTATGQRASINEAARTSTARFVMKLDAHCRVDTGFDVKLMAPYDTGELAPETTTIPRLYNLHAFDWECRACHDRVYQGALPNLCAKCKSTEGFTRAMVWEPRWSRRTDFTRFDHQLIYQYWQGVERRPCTHGDLAETMSQLGACWFVPRAYYARLGGLDEAHGSWGQVGTEWSCKTWLSGGRQVVNKRTWYSHMFRTHGGPEWGFPYELSQKQVDQARAHSRSLWYDNTWPTQTRPLAWLVEHFAPIPGWHEPDAKTETGEHAASVAQHRERTLAHVRAQGERFAQAKGEVAA